MSTARDILLSDARQELLRPLEALAGRNDLDEAFAAWLLPTQVPGLSSVGPARQAASNLDSAARTYKDVAVLGYASDSEHFEPPLDEALRVGLVWLTGRGRLLGGDPAPFCSDAVALLGVSVGARRLGDADLARRIADWMGSFIADSYASRRVEEWAKCLFAAAAQHVGASSALTLPDSATTADVRVALRLKGILPTTGPTAGDADDANSLRLLKSPGDEPLPTARATIRVAAFDWVQERMSRHQAAEKPSEAKRMPPANPNRTKVFISYSHEDRVWLDRLQVHLKPLEREGKLDRWDDTRIKTSQKWKEEIRKALEATRVAVLLISADFLASDFIAENELPPLLAAAEEDGALIMPVIISPCRFTATPSLSQFQAVNPDLRPLVGMRRNKREELWVKLTNDIEEALKS